MNDSQRSKVGQLRIDPSAKRRSQGLLWTIFLVVGVVALAAIFAWRPWQAETTRVFGKSKAASAASSNAPARTTPPTATTGSARPDASIASSDGRLRRPGADRHEPGMAQHRECSTQDETDHGAEHRQRQRLAESLGDEDDVVVAEEARRLVDELLPASEHLGLDAEQATADEDEQRARDQRQRDVDHRRDREQLEGAEGDGVGVVGAAGGAPRRRRSRRSRWSWSG